MEYKKRYINELLNRIISLRTDIKYYNENNINNKNDVIIERISIRFIETKNVLNKEIQEFAKLPSLED